MRRVGTAPSRSSTVSSAVTTTTAGRANVATRPRIAASTRARKGTSSARTGSRATSPRSSAPSASRTRTAAATRTEPRATRTSGAASTVSRMPSVRSRDQRAIGASVAAWSASHRWCAGRAGSAIRPRSSVAIPETTRTRTRRSPARALRSPRAPRDHCDGRRTSVTMLSMAVSPKVIFLKKDVLWRTTMNLGCFDQISRSA